MIARTISAVLVVTCFGLSAVAGSAMAAKGTPVPYAVKSISLSYSSTATATTAIESGVPGTRTTTLTTTLTGRAKPGTTSALRRPEVVNEYFCSPTCPQYRVNGVVRISEVFRPNDPAISPTSCTSSRRLPSPSEGTVDLAASPTTITKIRARLVGAETANDLYGQARDPGCPLSTFFPLGEANYTAFGTTLFPTAKLGANRITLALKNTIPSPTYPWPTTGGNTMTAKIVLEKRK